MKVPFRNHINDVLINNVNYDTWKELYNSLNLIEENNINLQEYHDTEEVADSKNDDIVRNPFE